MKMIKIFITDIIQDENVHIIEDIYFHVCLRMEEKECLQSVYTKRI